MKTILAKFRPVTKYGVAVLLAAASFFSAFAEDEQHPGEQDPMLNPCVWIWDGVRGGWNVSCTLTGTFFIPDDSPGGAGSCTNCVRMSPAECEAIKQQIIGECAFLTQQIPNLQTAVSDSISEMMDSLTEVRRLKDEGEKFLFFSGITHVPGADNYERNDYLMGLENPASIYLNGFGPSSPATHATYAMGGTSGIYNYYNNAVAPVLNDLETMLLTESASLNDVVNTLRELNSSAALISSTASKMNCQACQNSSGDSGGGSSSACPCAEAIYAVRDAVTNCYTRLTEITERLDGWDNTFKKVSSFIDYMKSAMSTLSYMGTNFVYATQYRKLDDTTFGMKQLHKDLWSTNGFDFISFGGLTWFSRVEYLLMNVAGVFDFFDSSSSDVGQVLDKTSQMESETETRKTELEGYLDDLKEVSPTMVFSDKVEKILKLFKDSFGVNQRPDWSQVYMIEGNMESFGIDLNGTMRVRAFEGIDDLDSVNDFLDFIRRFCQVVYTCATIYLLWIVFVWVWGHFVSWMKIILPFYTSIFS